MATASPQDEQYASDESYDEIPLSRRPVREKSPLFSRKLRNRPQQPPTIPLTAPPPTIPPIPLPAPTSVSEFMIAQQQQQGIIMEMLRMLQQRNDVATRQPMPDTQAPIFTQASSYRLTGYDPDDSSYSMNEWVQEADTLRLQLQWSDALAINRAADALKGRARRFINEWRPLQRTWEALMEALITAFPDQKTFGMRWYDIATLKSTAYQTTSEYGTTKIRMIYRIIPSLPWADVLSLVEHGLEDRQARSAICLQQPPDEATLLRLLSNADARRDAQRKRPRSPGSPRARRSLARPRQRHPAPPFEGTCHNCGKRGHRIRECPHERKRENDRPTPTSNAAVITCTHCRKVGHSEAKCWAKHGREPRVLVIKPKRDLHQTNIATLLSNGGARDASFLIDSGADVSIISEQVVNDLGVTKTRNAQTLSGFGSSTVATTGRCDLIVTLPTATLEVTFMIVQARHLPRNLDVIIGWDVISRRGLRVQRGTHGLELHYDELVAPKRVLAISTARAYNLSRSGLAEREQETFARFLNELSLTTPPAVTTGTLKIQLRDAEPVAQHPRRLAYAERLQLRKIIQDLMDQGIVRASTSSYASPIVLVQKKTGDLRLCVDYRELNNKTSKNRYPLPLIHDLLDALCQAKYFTTIDMKAGFHQVLIDENSRQYTAFVTPDGHYEYNRMPFGLTNGPACYQRAIDAALGPLKGTKAYVYLDDVLITSKTIEEGLRNVREVLTVLARAGFSPNFDKCEFFRTETEYLGYVISAGNVKPSPRKVEALRNSAVPTDVHSVRQLMGLASYFRRFVQGFAQIMSPI